MTRMVRMTPNTARLLSKAVQYSCHSSHSGDTAVRLSVAPLPQSFRKSAMNPKKSAADVHPRRLPLSIRRGYASRAVIGTLRPTERRRANPSKWVDRISSLELYVLPKETGNQLECRLQPVIQVACQNGAEGARTPDLLGAIQALSQLSYSPAHAGTGERCGSLAPGSPEDNSPARFAGPRSSCWMITAFAARVKRTPSLRDGPGHHPSRVNTDDSHALRSDSFQYVRRRAMGGDPTTFVVSQTAHTPPGVVPPPLHLPRACNGARGPKKALLRTRPTRAVPGNIWRATQIDGALAHPERRP